MAYVPAAGGGLTRPGGSPAHRRIAAVIRRSARAPRTRARAVLCSAPRPRCWWKRLRGEPVTRLHRIAAALRLPDVRLPFGVASASRDHARLVGQCRFPAVSPPAGSQRPGGAAAPEPFPPYPLLPHRGTSQSSGMTTLRMFQRCRRHLVVVDRDGAQSSAPAAKPERFAEHRGTRDYRLACPAGFFYAVRLSVANG